MTARGKSFSCEGLAFEWCRSRRWSLTVAWFGGAVACFAIASFLFNTDLSSIHPLKPQNEWNPSSHIAVVGAGPSGLSAAWLLAMGGRRVTLFEAADDIGGHSQTYVEPDGSGKNYDLGFIFNNAGYLDFLDFAEAYGHSLVSMPLCTASYYSGRYWDNTRTWPESGIGRGKTMESEVKTFMAFVKKPPTLLRALLPFGIWLWFNGFTKDFVMGPIASTLSVLFVTKMGMKQQSTQVILNQYSDTGFLHLLDGTNKVQRGARGSQFMWREVLEDAKRTGHIKVVMNRRLSHAEDLGSIWRLKFTDGSAMHGFSDVILALPGYVAANVVRGRALQRFLVNQIDYVESSATLHTDVNATLHPKFSAAGPEVNFFVDTKTPVMTGRIARVFGYRDHDTLLSIHAAGRLNIDQRKIKWRTSWLHHNFCLWELLVTRKFIPFVQAKRGLHYAGDYVQGVGHNDAIRAGIAAACRVGVPRNRNLEGSAQRRLYRALIQRNCPKDR